MTSRTLVRILAAGALALAVGSSAACSRDDKRAGDPARVEPAKVGSLDVDQLDKLLTANECQVIDANGAPTRERMGVIPGATLLTDYVQYKLEELPADKARKLVFYCANEHCGASHEAAERAIIAGYTDVNILPAGIAGWRGAGKSTKAL